MPCIFLKNIPFQFAPVNHMSNFEPTLTQRLRRNIARCAGCAMEDVKIHLSFSDLYTLQDSGKVEHTPNIYGFVLWFEREGRDDFIKQEIANTLQHFLNMHSIGKGFELTFVGSPAGSFYHEDHGISVKVNGGEPVLPFSTLQDMITEYRLRVIMGK